MILSQRERTKPGDHNFTRSWRSGQTRPGIFNFTLLSKKTRQQESVTFPLMSRDTVRLADHDFILLSKDTTKTRRSLIIGKDKMKRS
jgi:hypothetical protein